MEQDLNSLREAIVQACGGYVQALDKLMSFSRVLWDVALSSPPPPSLPKKSRRDLYYWSVGMKRLLGRTDFNPPPLQDLIFRCMRLAGLSDRREGDFVGFSRPAFQPITLLRQILPPHRPDHDLRYFAMANTRKHYRSVVCSSLAEKFQILAEGLSSIERHRKPGLSGGEEGKSYSTEYPYLMNTLQACLEKIVPDAEDCRSTIQLFLECCRSVNYLQAGDKHGWLLIRPSIVDTAFLFSNLFGLSTGISGFDELFGGGGLILPDELVRGNRDQISGRAILTMGRYGTGKSLLSMQFALEVARKGGLAYVMAVEQSPKEYLYGIASVCPLPRDSVFIATDSASARRALQRKDSRGALVLVNPLKESFSDFLATFRRDLKLMDRYDLKLVVVDPVNAISRGGTSINELRSETLEMLNEAKLTGTNIWLAAEEISELAHEQNIADTVIRLSVDHVGAYTQRHFEITKSRFQREQRGRHAFSILPGQGIKIFPSAAAVSARINSRSIRPPQVAIKFGLPALDDILGENSISAGDIIVLQGASGTFKTPLGLSFLFGMDIPKGGYATAMGRRTQSLFVAARDNPSTVRHLMTDRLAHEGSKNTKARGDIRIRSIPSGYVKPGYVFQAIEEELLQARLRGYSVDRVMLDNIGHWDLSCPFIHDEETFGDTLVDLLRRHQTTTLFTCGELNNANASVLQQSIIDSADCLIQFHRVEFRGVYRVMIRVLKTRGMRHRREFFELLVGPRSIDVDTKSSLLRISPQGEVEPVNVRLFLHHENAIQRKYNEEWVGGLRSVLSPNIRIDRRDSNDFLKGMKWRYSSAVDELQLCQIDEFQLPDIHAEAVGPRFQVFNQSQWKLQWDSLLPRLKKRVRSANKGYFSAIPFFENVSLLACRQTYQHSEGKDFQPKVSSWQELAEQCEAWERQHPDPKALFFDFAGGADENYNCLFFEILLSMGAPPVDGEGCLLKKWLLSKESVQACHLYRCLCRRSHFAKGATGISKGQKNLDQTPPLSPEAIVWRLWYSTANQLMAVLKPEERTSIEVTALPGGVSIAGEWFLAAPVYSAASDVGLQIIEMLTSHEAELERLKRGVGLPTRSTFYQSSSNVIATVSPYFAMDLTRLNKLVNNAFTRSSFACYGEIAAILASHLKRIIEVPAATTPQIETVIHETLRSLESQLWFVRSDFTCDRCRTAHSD